VYLATSLIAAMDDIQHNTHGPRLEVPTKVLWKNVDSERFYELSGQYMEAIGNPFDMSVDELVTSIISALYNASTDALVKPNGPKHRQGKFKWCPTLKPLVKQAKAAFKVWKVEGRPTDSSSWAGMKEAKRQLRAAQRQIEAKARIQRQNAIMEAAESDHRLLHKLVAKECKVRDSSPEIMDFDGELVHKDQLVHAWADYFEKLATPSDKPHYRQDYKSFINLKYAHIQDNSNSDQNRLIPLVTPDTVSDVIASLKNNKAADIHGLTAEHLKLGHPYTHQLITVLIKRILAEDVWPDQLKHGLITPVYKQKKSMKLPDNYRRITVVPMLGKILEKIIVKPTKNILVTKLSNLQRGFCDSSSSINTALLISEAIAEAKDSNIPLYIAFLDASKAFDVVWHRSMLCRIHDLGITNDLWDTYNNLYMDVTSQVKHEGYLSRSISESQGVRQGGIPSTELFKARGDALLKMISTSNLGFTVGSIDVSAPTCADDMVLIGQDPVALQSLLHIATFDACRERYEFSSTKTKVMVVNSRVKTNTWDTLSLWEMNGRVLDVTNMETHLGIERMDNGRATKAVECNIQKARRASYSLLGAGMYGINGLHVRVNLRLWNCYVLPRLTYGLEVLPLTDTDIADLDSFQRQTFKRFLHLPPGTSSSGLYLALGQLPVREVIARNVLTLFINIARNTDSLEYKILGRQLAVKTPESNSWINLVKTLLVRYDLPSIHELFLNPPPKLTWKRVLRDHMESFLRDTLQADAATKSTLRYMGMLQFKIGALHPVLASVPDSPQDILRSCVKIRFLLGQYRLQIDIARHTGGSPLCKTCNHGLEDMNHLVFDCNPLRDLYNQFISRVKSLVDNPVKWNFIIQSRENVIQLVVDCTKILVNTDLELIYRIETVTRNYVYAVHCRRSALQGN
jgi:hypothetical protein